MKKLTHSVNMANFIDQMGSEHDLIEELVTNALEAAETIVRVDRGTDVDGNIFVSIFNDGVALTESQIESKLLRSFETGDEKIAAESNRGLGFVAIYGAMKNTVVISGSTKITINSWDDIIVEDNYGKEVKGLLITVHLTNEAAKRYTDEYISELCNRWIIGENITLLCNHLESGRAISNIPEMTKYTDGMYYIINDLTFSVSDFGAYLKLTNRNIYRELPISFNVRDEGCMLLEDLHVIITKGKHLNTSRTGFTWEGSYAIKAIIRKECARLMKDALKEGFSSAQSNAIDIINKALLSIANATGIKKARFNKGMEHISTHIKKATEAEGITYQIRRINKLIDLINEARSIKDDVMPIGYFSVFGMLAEGMSQEKINSSYYFSDWFTKTFGFDQALFFFGERVGLYVEDGNIAGEATLLDLVKKLKKWTPMDTEVFQGNALEGMTMVIVFNADAEFYTDISEMEIEWEAQASGEKTTVKDDGSADKFGIEADQARDMTTKEIIEMASEGRSFSGKTKEGRAVTVDDADVYKKLADAGFYADATPYIHDDDDVKEIASALEEEPAVFIVKEEDSEMAELIAEYQESENFLSENIDNAEEYETTKAEMEINETQVRIWKIGETEIPCLVKEGATSDFAYNLKYPGPKREKRVIEAYNQWKKTIELIFETIDNIPKTVVPVVLFNPDRDVTASLIGKFIGINYWSLPKLSDPKLMKMMHVLETAVHEVCHIWVTKHANPNFQSYYNTIWSQCVLNRDFLKKLKEVF